MGIQYRPEIDGLRAVAVLAVVLYHAGVGGAGFVGVDVFFVISGYLITALLLDEQRATGDIDLLAFYARRMRRIFPAAAVLVLVVLVVSTVLLPAAQRVHTANSAGAALAFVANAYFQFTSGGYFDTRAEQMPLLHLWSLSVEEQFYLLWPALLLLVPSRWLRPSLVLLAMASLAMAEGWVARGSDAAFYAMPARFWELAAGGLVAAAPARAMPRWTMPLGLVVALAACVHRFDHFPGVGALPAVLGACMIIAAVHGGARSRVLASRPLVAVGLVSYSLYLWHWPLLAFQRATTIGEPTIVSRLALCVVAGVLATASWRYVERPFRRLRLRSGRTIAAGAAVSIVLGLSACAYGVSVRPAPADAAAADKPKERCRHSGMVPPACPEEAGATIAMWGDSMAFAWTPAFGHVIDYSRDACPPFLGYLSDDAPLRRACSAWNDDALAAVRGYRTVVIAAWWMGEVDALDHVAPTLAALKDVPRVIVIGPTPVLPDEAPRCIRLHAPAACTISRQAFDRKARPILARLRALSAPYPNVEVRDVSDAFCTSTDCPPVLEGVALYWDAYHVSSTAAERFRYRNGSTVAAFPVAP